MSDGSSQSLDSGYSGNGGHGGEKRKWGKKPEQDAEKSRRQSEAERRDIRRQYNELKHKVKNQRFQSDQDLSQYIKEADKLLEVVEKKEMTAREAVLDANVFKQISTRCREQAQVINWRCVEYQDRIYSFENGPM